MAYIPLDNRASLYAIARESGSTEGASRLLEMAADLGIKTDGIKPPVRVINLRTGRHQKAAGAWSWVLVDADGREIIGSADTVAEVLRAHRDGKAALIDQWYLPYTPEVSA